MSKTLIAYTIAALAFICSGILGINAVLVIIGCACLGLITSRIMPGMEVK